ncbi:MAG: hypothetical protein LQ340_006282 [Diploschistes diacapsis]|nr:MAG: hypothetical protein LQ340_006282 [Diploschistes diacapsis]
MDTATKVPMCKLSTESPGAVSSRPHSMTESSHIEKHVDDIDPEKEPHGYYRPSGAPREDDPNDGISVKRAEAEFAELSRELSNFDEKHRKLSRTTSRKTNGEIDIEKTESSQEDEPFNLEEALRGNREAEMQAGIKPKQIGVVWENLTVKGLGGVKTIVQTFPDAFVSFFNFPGKLMRRFGFGPKGDEIDILKHFKGVVKPGEMCLVLGNPGAGCTSFLKVISNQRFGYTKVDGEVLYGTFDADTFAKNYRGEAIYNQEDDVHEATLTVAQTLGFALDVMTPGKRPVGMGKKEFKDKVVDLLLQMFNIQHTRNTLVGSAFVRGISGGERKRVSIAEMMVSSACVLAWDNSTRGLDASTASDYAKSLRIITNVYQTTTFVSLYQASETIYSQFDKVMVIDSGREVFFGPAKEARKYFEDLGFKEKPRQTTPDYVVGCTNRFEREYKENYSPKNAPYDSDSLARAFLESDHAKRLDQEMAEYKLRISDEKGVYEDFRLAHREAKRKGASKSSVYTTSLLSQIGNIMRRQTLIKWQDKFSLYVSWATSIFVAIVLGTVWLKLPQTSEGAFTRGGLIFMALLFNAFQAFGELGSIMLGRPLVSKHRAFTFYRPSALWLAQIFVDGLFAAAKITVFAIIVYFMCGLVLEPGAFFIFVLIVVTGYLVMTVFFRTVGCLCPDFDVALRAAIVIVTFFVLTNGYLIQWNNEQVWLRWLFYLNGLGLGFSALMVNEFSRIDLTCTSENLIPSGPGYNDLNHQVCTSAGGTPGKPVISGSSYILDTYQYAQGDLWRNWGIMVALIVFFLSLNVWFGEIINWGAGGRTITTYSKETEELKKLNAEMQKKKQSRLERRGDQGSELTIASKAALTWESLNYDVPVSGGHRRLLSDVFGYVKPGQLTALMGASGAGKTTLLDVLAARKNIGIISGDILVDGKPPGSSFQRGTAYAEQLDVHESTATVREALRFSADLRQPFSTSRQEKYAYVEEVISLLEMEDIADAVIGVPEAGLAVEQRKRVTIGVELASKPELLLFLDEPTSGLDSSSAFNIVRFLKKLAASGQCILCTIHQPNAALFESFDRLLLLQQGGECVYFGDIGRDAHVLRNYFHRNGADCPSDANPAEWMLDAIGAGLTKRLGAKDWGQIWRESPEAAQTKQDIVHMKEQRMKVMANTSPLNQKEYATPLWYQLKIVGNRTHLAFWRSANYGFTRLFNHVAVALIAGFTYFQLNSSRASLQERVFIIFQFTVLPLLIITQVEPKYDLSRLIFYREAAAKAYGQFAFSVSMVLAEMPYSIICAVAFFLPLYYIPGLQPAPDRAGYQFLMCVIVELFSVTLGQMISALTPSTYIAMLWNSPIIITFSLFCGVTIPQPQIPGFWRAWLYQLNPFTRLIGGMVVTELQGRPVVCEPGEYNRFMAPPGQTCGQYMERYFAGGGLGYIADNDTSNCEYCAYKVGDQFYQSLGYEFANRWRDLGIMAAFVASNLIILFIGSRCLNWHRR